MSGHTPGPWSDERMVGIAGAHKTGLNLAFICSSSDERRGECEANARLIAAAPELLAVCESYSLPLGGVYKRDCFEFGQMEVDRELARRAAIAKATGEAA